MTHTSALSHIRWIGGGSGAGKSVIARKLAAKHNAALYDTDKAMAEHAKRCDPKRCPNLMAFLDMSIDARWVDRTPQVMLETFHWFKGEGFDLILEDLRGMPRDRPILVEGFRLLPHLVAPMLTELSDAVWLLPTADFRRCAFDKRGSTMEIPNRTSNPGRALANLLERDAMFTERLQSEVKRLGLRTLFVNGSISEADMTDDVGDILFR